MRSVAVLSMHTSPLAQPGTGDSGGMNVYVRELSAALAQRGLVVTVYVRRDDADAPAVVHVEPGFRVVHVDAGPPTATKDQLPGLIDAFAHGVVRHQADHPADVIHANYWLSAQAGRTVRSHTGAPMVTTFHTLARVKAEHGDAESAHRDAVEAELVAESDAICVSNPVEEDQITSLFPGGHARTEVIPPGVDHAFFSPGDRRGARMALGLGDGPVVLFVGRIQPLKGLDLAVAALSELDRLPAATDRPRLVVVGGPSGPDGPAEVAKVESMVAALGLRDQVVMVPPQPHHLLSTYYRSADVVVVPSRSESFGLVALEAAACGVPVVAAEVGGLRSLVHDGVTGFLIDSRDPVDYAKRIEQILGDPPLGAAIGSAASLEAGRYSWSSAAGRLQQLYDDVIQHAPVGCCC